MTVLVAYATKVGSTRDVAEAVASELAQAGLDVEVVAARTVHDARRYDAIVLGAALYVGRLHPDGRRFLRRHAATLAQRPFAVFALGPKTLAEEDVAASRAQLERALAQVPAVRPVASAIFGGVVDPEHLGFPFNRMPASDARDWDAIAAWARDLAAALGAPVPA